MNAFRSSIGVRHPHWLTQLVLFAAIIVVLFSELALAMSMSPPTQERNQLKPGQALETANGSKRHTIYVGSTRAVKTIAAASLLVKAGDVVEVDAGDYVGDVAVWNIDNVTVRAIGGRARLLANGFAAEKKAIWVVRASGFSVDGFDFQGAKVGDRNGAGIRFESGSLLVRNCTFLFNETGLLTSDSAVAELVIEQSEFGHNGGGDGQSHNLYVGAIARLVVIGSYFHHGRVGHLLKSRAAVNFIRNNRLTDEVDGRASYELEFPTGGVAYVIGNLIQQGPLTKNRHIISYGAEGYRGAINELYLVNNTLIDDLPGRGRFLWVRSGAAVVQAVNNLLVGNGTMESAATSGFRNNFSVDEGELARTVDSAYRLHQGFRLLGRAVDPGSVNGVPLMLEAEYVHPRMVVPLDGPVRHPGALQRMQ